jgi:hypothetical protein
MAATQNVFVAMNLELLEAAIATKGLEMERCRRGEGEWATPHSSLSLLLSATGKARGLDCRLSRGHSSGGAGWRLEENEKSQPHLECKLATSLLNL